MSSSSPNNNKPFSVPSSSSRKFLVERTTGKQKQSQEDAIHGQYAAASSAPSFKNQPNIPIRSYGTMDFQHHFYTNTNNFITHHKQNNTSNVPSSSPTKQRPSSRKRTNSFNDRFLQYSMRNSSNNEDSKNNVSSPSSPAFKDIHRSSTLLDGLHFHSNLSDADNLSDSFEDSHPSSSDEDDDDGSSLDDVCLPIVTQSTSKKAWPDLQVLQDFYNEEIEESLAYRNSLEQQQQMQVDPEAAISPTSPEPHDGSLLQDTASSTSYSSSVQQHSVNLAAANNKSHHPVVGFRANLVSKVDGAVPGVISNSSSNLSLPNFTTRKINETEQIKGRLRPPVFSPWDNKSIKQNLSKYLPNDLNLKQQQQHKSAVAPTNLINSNGAFNGSPPRVLATTSEYYQYENGNDAENETHPLLSPTLVQEPHHQMHNNDIIHNHNKIPHESLSYQQQVIGLRRFEQFRYTYFRPNLDSTIHSSSISGLLQDGQTFADLFVREKYSAQEPIVPTSIIKTTPPTASPLRDASATDVAGNSPMIPSTNSEKSNTSKVNNNAEISPVAHNGKVNSSSSSSQQQQQPVSLPQESIGSSGTGTGVNSPTPPAGATVTTASPSAAPASSENPIPFWLDVLDPTEEEMKVLSKAFGIHPLTTEDIFLNEAREKVELFKDYYFICFRSFDIVHERLKRKALNEKLAILERLNLEELRSHGTFDENNHYHRDSMFTNLKKALFGQIFRNGDASDQDDHFGSSSSRVSPAHYPSDFTGSSFTHGSNIEKRADIMRDSKLRNQAIAKIKRKIKKQKSKDRDLEPLNFYIIVFHSGVLTFHFSPTPHPVTVRRRARLLKDYLTVSSDWIAYALIDDITDAFGPMIETIEEEVYSFEDAILKLHSKDNDSDDSEEESSEDEESEEEYGNGLEFGGNHSDRRSVFSKKTNGSRKTNSSNHSRSTLSSRSSASSSSLFSSTTSGSSSSSRASGRWAKKGHMLRKIGESRKRIMSLLRLLGSKADVIKGLSKRCNENFDVAPRSEIGMYLGDIQDHILTMVQSLNHYEKLLARSHSNYLAQINIDMTKVNNDMNDVLGKITVLGTLVLPMNIITGLWGMNVIVPGQNDEGLQWFFGILASMLLLCIVSYYFTVKFYNF